MKQVLFILSLSLMASFGFCQAGYIPNSNQMFSTAADLRKQAGVNGVTVQLNGITTYNDGAGGTYVWDSTSVTTDDNLNAIGVTGLSGGRWIRLKNQNSVKSQSTFSGVSLTTSYVVTHSLNFTPLMVLPIPRTANAAAPFYVSNITSTTFTITFMTVPVVGTNNITFDWIAIKQ